jgi:hypothetical protein
MSSKMAASHLMQSIMKPRQKHGFNLPAVARGSITIARGNTVRSLARAPSRADTLRTRIIGRLSSGFPIETPSVEYPRAGKEALRTVVPVIVSAIENRLIERTGVIWAFGLWVWPEASIDHINGDQDNRLVNLLRHPLRKTCGIAVFESTASWRSSKASITKGRFYASAALTGMKLKPRRLSHSRRRCRRLCRQAPNCMVSLGGADLSVRFPRDHYAADVGDLRPVQLQGSRPLRDSPGGWCCSVWG